MKIHILALTWKKTEMMTSAGGNSLIMICFEPRQGLNGYMKCIEIQPCLLIRQALQGWVGLSLASPWASAHGYWNQATSWPKTEIATRLSNGIVGTSVYVLFFVILYR